MKQPIMNQSTMEQQTKQSNALSDVATPSSGAPDAGSMLASEVASQAKQRLGSTSYQFLRFVDCCFQNGVLTLRGRVPTFYLKQMAQSVLANIEGVDRIDNRVDVVSPRGLSSVR